MSLHDRFTAEAARKSARSRLRLRSRRLVLALVLLGGCGSPDAGAPGPRVDTLTVSAAASLQDALGEIARAYEAENPDVRLRLNFAASGTLQQQIRLGAPVDLFLSAADRQMDALQAQGLIDPSTRRAFAGNELVLIVPARGGAAIDGFADLASPRVRRVAMGAPESVPAGRYAAEVLRSLGIADVVGNKALLGQHVRQVLAYTERGEVDAAIVYRTDAAGRPGVRIVAGAPEGSHVPITYPLAVVAASPHPEQARRLAAHLTGPEAQDVLRRFGFRSAGSPAEPPPR